MCSYIFFIAVSPGRAFGQAMLSRLAFLLKQDGGSEGSEAQSAASAVPSFAAPLLQSLEWLSREISASHVIRSVVCVLSGLPVVAERKVPPPSACLVARPPSRLVTARRGSRPSTSTERGSVRAAGEAAERHGQVLHRRDLLLPSARRIPR